MNCSATVSQRIAAAFHRDPATGEGLLAGFPNVDGVVALTHRTGCGQAAEGTGIDVLRRTMGGFAKHVNFGATFTVAIWLWAYAYSAIQTLVPGSFTAAVDPEAQRSWLELLFLSTTTMTSTGLSDVVPIKPVARSVVMIQQIGGMLYLAVAVSRIVGLTLARSRQRDAG